MPSCAASCMYEFLYEITLPVLMNRMVFRKIPMGLLLKAFPAIKLDAFSMRRQLQAHRLDDNKLAKHDWVQFHAKFESLRGRRWYACLPENPVLGEFVNLMVFQNGSPPDLQIEIGTKRNSERGPLPCSFGELIGRTRCQRINCDVRVHREDFLRNLLEVLFVFRTTMN